MLCYVMLFPSTAVSLLHHLVYIVLKMTLSHQWKWHLFEKFSSMCWKTISVLELCADFIVAAAARWSILVGGVGAAWSGWRSSLMAHTYLKRFSAKNIYYKDMHFQQ